MRIKITFIDVLVVLVVIAAVIFAVLRVNDGQSIVTKPVTYTVLITEQIPEVAENIKPAENVLLDTATNSMGDVIDVQVTASGKPNPDVENGVFVWDETDERKDIYVTIKTNATDNEWGYDIGEQHIRIGESQTISARDYALVGYIVDIDE